MSISIVDIIPASQSSETGLNAEPSLAVNPANPQQLVATTFGGEEISGSTFQPYWIYTNGGMAWSSFGSLVHFDSTLAFTQDGSAVLTAALIGSADTPNPDVGNWNLTQGLGGGRSDAFQAGLYGATRWGPAYLAAAFDFSNYWMSTDRVALIDHLTANFNAQSYGGRVEGGYRFATPYAGITPYAAIQPQSFHTPAYAETDAILNAFGLAFPSRDATDTRSELGSRFDRVLALYPDAVLTLRARVAWAHDWVSNPILMPVFQTLPGASFIVNGALPPHNSALTSAGAELRFTNGVTLLAKFEGDFAPGSSTYGGIGAVRYTW